MINYVDFILDMWGMINNNNQKRRNKMKIQNIP